MRSPGWLKRDLMNDYFNKIETEIIGLIEEWETREYVSTRDVSISNLIVSNYYNRLTDVHDQIRFKDFVADLLFKYLYVTGNLADAFIYHLLQVVSMIKIPIGNLLTDILHNEVLVGRYYYDGGDSDYDYELNFLVLRVLSELPTSYRTEAVLGNLVKRPTYKDSVPYNLHFLDFFVAKEKNNNVNVCLNNLLALRIIDDMDIDLIGFQLYSSFTDLDPKIFRNWYLSKLKNPSDLKGNNFNKSLLLFVEDAREAREYYRDDWYYTFNLIETFANAYIIFEGQKQSKASDILSILVANNMAYGEQNKIDLNAGEVRIILNRCYETLEISQNDEEIFRSASEVIGQGFRVIAEMNKQESVESAAAAGTG